MMGGDTGYAGDGLGDIEDDFFNDDKEEEDYMPKKKGKSNDPLAFL